MIRSALILLLIQWLLFAFIIGIKMVPNDDMYPNIKAGDIMMYYRLNKTPNAQDIIFLRKNKTDYVGRVVAGAGDTVEVTKEGNLLINGNMVTESNIFFTTPLYEGFVEYPLKLSNGKYFVLADKREGGEDSRYYGPVDQKEIKGTLIGLYRRAGF